MAAPFALAALVATLMSSTGAFPHAASRHSPTARVTLGPAALRYGRSLGSPTDGHLIGGMHFEETAYVRMMPADTAGDVRWGLEPLVTMIDRAARSVRRQFPDAITSVGHMSREGGGEVEQHRSHESGRDVDVGFFVRAASGKQLLETHFVPFRADGTAPSWPGAYFDDGKNWALVSALLADPQAHVTHLFVAAPLRARLLAYAEHRGLSPAVRMRAAEVMQQPHGSLPHDDHFHVRIGCPAHMSGCVENPAVRLAASAHPSELAVARGRRGAVTHALVTPAPSRAKPFAEPPAGSIPIDIPSEVDPEAKPREGDHSDHSDHKGNDVGHDVGPPPSAPNRLDDVDG